MFAVEFEANIRDGVIEVPKAHRGRITGPVHVKLLSADDAVGDAWQIQNRRRWELIEKRLNSELTPTEAIELKSLQREAESELSRVGPRPLTRLEEMESQLQAMETPSD